MRKRILVIEDEKAISELICMNPALVDIMLPGRDTHSAPGKLAAFRLKNLRK